MAIIEQKQWGHINRPWGFEVRVDFVNDVTNEIYNETFTFKDKAESIAEIDNRIADKIVFLGTKETLNVEVTSEDGTTQSY